MNQWDTKRRVTRLGLEKGCLCYLRALDHKGEFVCAYFGHRYEDGTHPPGPFPSFLSAAACLQPTYIFSPTLLTSTSCSAPARAQASYSSPIGSVSQRQPIRVAWLACKFPTWMWFALLPACLMPVPYFAYSGALKKCQITFIALHTVKPGDRNFHMFSCDNIHISKRYTGCGISQLTAAHFVGGHIFR
jgi:hypothetical protein